MARIDKLHGLSDSEWYARAIQERGNALVAPSDIGYNHGEDLRVCLVLKKWCGSIEYIVAEVVEKVWREYRIVEVVKTRHGTIVVVEEGGPDAP
jgi:hypothetical protein